MSFMDYLKGSGAVVRKVFYLVNLSGRKYFITLKKKVDGGHPVNSMDWLKSKVVQV